MNEELKKELQKLWEDEGIKEGESYQWPGALCTCNPDNFCEHKKYPTLAAYFVEKDRPNSPFWLNRKRVIPDHYFLIVENQEESYKYQQALFDLGFGWPQSQINCGKVEGRQVLTDHAKKSIKIWAKDHTLKMGWSNTPKKTDCNDPEEPITRRIEDKEEFFNNINIYLPIIEEKQKADKVKQEKEVKVAKIPTTKTLEINDPSVVDFYFLPMSSLEESYKYQEALFHWGLGWNQFCINTKKVSHRTELTEEARICIKVWANSPKKQLGWTNKLSSATYRATKNNEVAIVVEDLEHFMENIDTYVPAIDPNFDYTKIVQGKKDKSVNTNLSSQEQKELELEKQKTELEKQKTLDKEQETLRLQIKLKELENERKS